jgi:hypothetical protein
MLLGKIGAEIQNVHPIVFLPLFIAILITITNCTAAKGSIVISENPDGTAFTMDFKEWSSQNKCELSLNAGDVVQIEVVREGGEIAFAVSGKSGSQPYEGNRLESVRFTVTVSETDDYVFRVTGKKATGKITAKKVG